MCMYCKRKDNKLLCDYCYNKYPIKMNLEYIPLDEYNCYLLSLFQNKNKINKYFYNDEISYVFNFFNNKGYHIVCIDDFSFNMDNIIIIDSITKLINGDILIMTNTVND